MCETHIITNRISGADVKIVYHIRVSIASVVAGEKNALILLYDFFAEGKMFFGCFRLICSSNRAGVFRARPPGFLFC